LTVFSPHPNFGRQRIPKKEFWHAAAMIYSVENNYSGMKKFPATRGRSDIYGDGCTRVSYFIKQRDAKKDDSWCSMLKTKINWIITINTIKCEHECGKLTQPYWNWKICHP
jgi:hypothetical protein